MSERREHLSDELAQAFADRTLAGDLREECQLHLARCPECRVSVESYRALADALEGLEAPPPPADFTAVVMARIDDVERARAWERRLAVGVLAAVAGLAAIAMIVAGTGAWAPVITGAIARLGDLATAAAVASDVLSPLLRALRLQIAVACLVAGLPLALALSRLVPRRAHVLG